MIMRPAAPLPPTSKTVTMLTAQYVCYDSEAVRPPPTYFQRHKNGDGPMFLMIQNPAAPLPPIPKTMKMMIVCRPPSRPLPKP